MKCDTKTHREMSLMRIKQKWRENVYCHGRLYQMSITVILIDTHTYTHMHRNAETIENVMRAAFK